MKILINLILISIIIASTNIIPINSHIFKINVTEIFEKKRNEIAQNEKKEYLEKNIVTRQLINSKDLYINPNDIEFQFDNMREDYKSSFNLKIYDFSKKLIKNIQNIDTNIKFLTNSSRIRINISREKLNLQDDNYMIYIESNIENYKFHDIIYTFYINDKLKLKKSEPNFNFGNIYYPLKNTNISVPIYTKIINQNNIFTSIFKTLSNEPNLENLFANIMPYNIWYSAGTLSVYYNDKNINTIYEHSVNDLNLDNLLTEIALNEISQDMEKKLNENDIQNDEINRYQEKFNNDIFYKELINQKKLELLEQKKLEKYIPENIKNSIINSFSQIQNKFIVNKVNFYYKNKLIDTHIINKNNISIFIPINLFENDIYLVPIDTQSDNIENAIKIAMNYYKNPPNLNKDVAIMPQNLNLKDVKIINKTLKLYFSKEFLEYKEHSNAFEILANSLYLSFKPYDINNIEFYVNNELIKFSDYKIEFNNKDFIN